MTTNNRETISEIFILNPELRKEFKIEVISSSAKTKANKSHENSRAAKAFAIDIAVKSWNEEPHETITAMVDYVQKQLINDGQKKYSPITIRRWINELAPPDIRKGGRPKRK